MKLCQRFHEKEKYHQLTEVLRDTDKLWFITEYVLIQLKMLFDSGKIIQDIRQLMLNMTYQESKQYCLVQNNKT